MIHIETVLGNNKNQSVAEDALGSRTIPCSIKRSNDNKLQHDGTDKFTNYDVFMSSTWRKRKGCYYIITVIPDRKQTQLEYNSPGSCSLFCESHDYFGLQDKMCVCLKKIDLIPGAVNDVCDKPCPDNKSKAKCGSSTGIWYFDVYHHHRRLEFNQNPVDQDDVDKKCMIASHLAETNVKYKAVACPRQSSGICFYEVGGFLGAQTLDKNLKPCYVYRDEQNRKTTDKLSNSNFFWTTLRRSKILIWKNEDRKYENAECQLEPSHYWNTTKLSLKSAGKTYPLITLRCDMKTSLEWTELCVKDMDNNENDAYNTPLSTASEYTSSANEKATFTTNTTEFESYGSSTNVELTSAYHSNTTDQSFYSENYVFFLHIGIAISGSCFVILIATVACCLYRPKRGTYTFPISRSEENIVMATEGPPQDTMPTAALAENYSEPKDKASSSSEMEGPRFCATTHCQSTNCQKAENGEYHHLDFTLRSETAPRFADNNEYAHVRANVISVFEQPWDAATSKVNKLFSQISKSVALKGQNIRNSIIKRRESRSGSPKLKCRASDYCDAWKTQLNKQQFVFDSEVDSQRDISIDIANSTVDSNKDKPKLDRTDSAFPVLPYSERINVKSTHIYDEPDERRMSLRERLLHMISIRPLKMPFGIELDLRASRSKSKIYSVATSLDEIDESVA